MDGERENKVGPVSPSSGWGNFDMDKFFRETDAVGKILEEKRKASGE